MKVHIQEASASSKVYGKYSESPGKNINNGDGNGIGYEVQTLSIDTDTASSSGTNDIGNSSAEETANTALTEDDQNNSNNRHRNSDRDRDRTTRIASVAAEEDTRLFVDVFPELEKMNSWSSSLYDSLWGNSTSTTSIQRNSADGASISNSSLPNQQSSSNAQTNTTNTTQNPIAPSNTINPVAEDTPTTTQIKQFLKADDFDPKTWLEVTGYNSERNLSTMGFAAVIAATVIIHPLVFVAGAGAAIWAVGALHAVETGYDLFSDGTFRHLFWTDSPTEVKDAIEDKDDTDNDEDENEDEDGPNIPVVSSFTSATGEVTISLSNSSLGTPVSTTSTAMTSSASTPVSSPRTTSSSSTTEVATKPSLPNSASLPPTVPSSATSLPIAKNIQSTKANDAAIQQHYPKLHHPIIQDLNFPGLNATEFFDVFFADNAPYGLKEFQETRGDIDINFGPWLTLDKKKYDADSDADSDADKGISFYRYKDASTSYKSKKQRPISQPKKGEGEALPSCTVQERTMHFKTLTKSYFGPAYAIARKTQRVTTFSNRLLIIEGQTELFDIPFSERFVVVDRWIVETEERVANSGGDSGDDDSSSSSLSTMLPIHYTTKVSVEAQLFMLKECTWESQIRTKSIAKIKEFLESWSVKSTQALKLTMKKKLERLGNQSSSTLKNEQYRQSMDDVSPSIPSTSSHGNDVKLEEVLKQHQVKLRKLEKKIAESGGLDLEWSDIEIRHNVTVGRGLAYAEVLDRNGSPLLLNQHVDTETNNKENRKENSSGSVMAPSNSCSRLKGAEQNKVGRKPSKLSRKTSKSLSKLRLLKKRSTMFSNDK